MLNINSPLFSRDYLYFKQIKNYFLVSAVASAVFVSVAFTSALASCFFSQDFADPAPFLQQDFSALPEHDFLVVPSCGPLNANAAITIVDKASIKIDFFMVSCFKLYFNIASKIKPIYMFTTPDFNLH